jgi:hypothetical protein
LLPGSDGLHGSKKPAVGRLFRSAARWRAHQEERDGVKDTAGGKKYVSKMPLTEPGFEPGTFHLMSGALPTTPIVPYFWCLFCDIYNMCKVWARFVLIVKWFAFGLHNK